jgi:hypothetical protein
VRARDRQTIANWSKLLQTSSMILPFMLVNHAGKSTIGN